jgi:phage shock protein C
MESVHESMRRQGLVRPAGDRVLGGVCSGLGRRFGFDAWSARLLFVLILLAVPGSQLIIYPILWILMPSEQATAEAPTSAVKTPMV